jgi:hypothetical protein
MRPALSIVVVAYDMARELPRTLRSLATGYQQHIAPDEYEVIVVDNGSPEPLDPQLLERFPSTWCSARIDPAPPAPARAANLGIEMAQADYIGLIIDGARMASPGLLSRALLARRLADRPVVATHGYHLGAARHMDAATSEYDQATEDTLLDELDWERDGYRLFSTSTLAASSARGWFEPMGESNALFMPKIMWDELGGFDEQFALPGGGLSNHDLFRRACLLAGAQLVVLLGEGTFHQIHGGAATSGRFSWQEMHAEYVTLRGEAYAPPGNDRLYVGGIPPFALPHIEASLAWSLAAAKRRSPE